MNLRGIANRLTQAVNPNISVAWIQAAGGYTTDATGTRTAITSAPVPVQAQVQALSSTDLKQMDGMNIQGVMRSVYLTGSASGVIRADQKGGDILQFPESPGGAVRNWRVTVMSETWPDWCRVIVVLQSP